MPKTLTVYIYIHVLNTSGHGLKPRFWGFMAFRPAFGAFGPDLHGTALKAYFETISGSFLLFGGPDCDERDDADGGNFLVFLGFRLC